MKTFALFVTLLWLVGCAAHNNQDYQEHQGQQPLGYQTQQVDDNHYLVTYTTFKQHANDATALFFMKRRAAELTLEMGFNEFRLVDVEVRDGTRTKYVPPKYFTAAKGFTGPGSTNTVEIFPGYNQEFNIKQATGLIELGENPEPLKEGEEVINARDFLKKIGRL